MQPHHQYAASPAKLLQPHHSAARLNDGAGRAPSRHENTMAVLICRCALQALEEVDFNLQQAAEKLMANMSFE